MARRKTKPHLLTELELQIMQVIWAKGNQETDVEEIVGGLAEQGRPIAPPSVRTMMGILEDKGFVCRRVEGRRHLFRAMVAREEAQRAIAEEVLEQTFQGSAPDFVAALLGSARVNRQDLARVKEILKEAERRGQGGVM